MSLNTSEVPFTVVSFGGVDVALLGTDATRGAQCLPFSLRSCTTRVVDSSESAEALTLREREWRVFVRATVSLDASCPNHWAVLTCSSESSAAPVTVAIPFNNSTNSVAELEAKLAREEVLSCPSTAGAPHRLYLVSDDKRSVPGPFLEGGGTSAVIPGVNERVMLGDSATDVSMAVGDAVRQHLEQAADTQQVTRVFWPSCSCIPLCAHTVPDELRRREHDALRLPFGSILRESRSWQKWGPPALHRDDAAQRPVGAAVRQGAPWEKELIRNPHEQMTKGAPQVDGAVTHIVTGSYDYYHYRVDGFNDDGWGCAYRSLQTILSWFQYEGLTDAPMPSLPGIQEILLRVDPDKAGKKQFVGSKEWIGSFEIMLVLQHALPGLECTIRRLESGAELDTNPDVQALLLSHFSQPRAAPVMIGGSAYAHTILGVHMNQSTMEARYLVLDPHYSSTTTVLKTVFNKRFLAWRAASELFATEHWYNLCIPRPDSFDPR